MKLRTIVSGLLVASLSVGSLSFAQPRHDPPGHGPRHDARPGPDRHDPRGGPGHRPDVRDDRRGPGANVYYNARSPEFRRGGRLPPHLRERQYVVNDWRRHRLSAPPRGYHWVQVGPDYVLAAIATGVIANLILNQ